MRGTLKSSGKMLTKEIELRISVEGLIKTPKREWWRLSARKGTPITLAAMVEKRGGQGSARNRRAHIVDSYSRVEKGGNSNARTDRTHHFDC